FASASAPASTRTRSSSATSSTCRARASRSSRTKDRIGASSFIGSSSDIEAASLGLANSERKRPESHDGLSFLNSVNWDDLKVFLAVASAGSLAGGARRLGVSQATTWRRIRALEDAMKVTLFERKASGYVITPVGSKLLGAIDGVQR